MVTLVRAVVKFILLSLKWNASHVCSFPALEYRESKVIVGVELVYKGINREKRRE